MAENDKTELAKYEKEIELVQKKLDELDEARQKVVRHGVRIEGVVAYLRKKLEDEAKADTEAKKEPSKLDELSRMDEKPKDTAEQTPAKVEGSKSATLK